LVTETVTVGGGCFWCLEPILLDLKGVSEVVSGYTGGQTVNPTYRQVCSETTGHAEVNQVTFDPDQISFRDILRVFFAIHDPTTRNRQGADIGTQYRSAIFYHSPEQQKVAREVIAELEASGIWGRPIVTEVAPAATFYRAEEYHQRYYEQNPEQRYCEVVIAPKVAKFRQSALAGLMR